MRAETVINTNTASLKAEHRMPLWVMPCVKIAVTVADAAIAAGCFLAAFKLREGTAIFSATAWAWSPEFVPYAGILYFAVPVRIAMLFYERVYQFQGAFSYTREVIKIFKAVGVGSLLITGWAFLFRGGFAFRDFSYSRGIFFIDFALALAFLLGFHLLLRAAQTRVRERGINLIPTLVVGTNAEAARAIRELRDRRDLGYRVIGAVRTNGDSVEKLEAEVVGSFDDLAALIREL